MKFLSKVFLLAAFSGMVVGVPMMFSDGNGVLGFGILVGSLAALLVSAILSGDTPEVY